MRGGSPPTTASGRPNPRSSTCSPAATPTPPPVARRRWLHHATPSLVEAVAEAWRIRGEPERAAAALLRDRIEEAVAAGDDPDTVERCRDRPDPAGQADALARPVPRDDVLSRSGTLVQAERGSPWPCAQVSSRPARTRPGSWYGWWQAQDRHSSALARPPAPPLAEEPGIPGPSPGVPSRSTPRSTIPTSPSPRRAILVRCSRVAATGPGPWSRTPRSWRCGTRGRRFSGWKRRSGSSVSWTVERRPTRRSSSPSWQRTACPCPIPRLSRHALSNQGIEPLSPAWLQRHRMLYFDLHEEVILGDGDPVELRFGAPLIRAAEEPSTFSGRNSWLERLAARCAR